MLKVGGDILNRKNLFPTLAWVVALLFVPSSLTTPTKFDQPFASVTLRFCCSTKPGEGDGHEMMALLPERVAVSNGSGNERLNTVP